MCAPNQPQLVHPLGTRIAIGSEVRTDTERAPVGGNVVKYSPMEANEIITGIEKLVERAIDRKLPAMVGAHVAEQLSPTSATAQDKNSAERTTSPDVVVSTAIAPEQAASWASLRPEPSLRLDRTALWSSLGKRR